MGGSPVGKRLEFITWLFYFYSFRSAFFGGVMYE